MHPNMPLVNTKAIFRKYNKKTKTPVFGVFVFQVSTFTTPISIFLQNIFQAHQLQLALVSWCRDRALSLFHLQVNQSPQ